MITWNDQTFCGSDCIKTDCARYAKDSDEENDLGLPLSRCDFSENCKDYQDPKKIRLMELYKENGYNSRDEYLTGLAETHGVGVRTVYDLADMLGENEDFDGLVVALEDANG